MESASQLKARGAGCREGEAVSGDPRRPSRWRAKPSVTLWAVALGGAATADQASARARQMQPADKTPAPPIRGGGHVASRPM
eukprot:8994220-Pyramimonas_sp.AAC.1